MHRLCGSCGFHPIRLDLNKQQHLNMGHFPLWNPPLGAGVAGDRTDAIYLVFKLPTSYLPFLTLVHISLYFYRLQSIPPITLSHPLQNDDSKRLDTRP